ncbi:MAG: S9 family peptidase [Actinobacteria bacterium]|nr:S9 family peptidase [Actinomycetota bacterium]
MHDRPRPPAAPARPVELTAHGDTRIDLWAWLQDRDDPTVIEYLEAENAYARAATTHTEALQKAIYQEIKGRVQETDVSPPTRRGPWDYFSRTFEGRQYPAHGRRPAGAVPGEGEVVLVDENTLAAGHEYFALGGLAVSPDDSVLAYSTDTTGGERYTLHFRDAITGGDLPDLIEDVYYGLAWANDNRTIFYTRPDAAVRPYQVWRHMLGTPAAEDALVLHEDDEHFFVSVGRARTGRYVLVGLDSKTTSEIHVVPADDPTAPARVVAPRRSGVEYSVEHHEGPGGGRFFIVTNADDARDFALMEAPDSASGPEHWVEVLPHRPGVRLDAVDAFAHHLVVSERRDGLQRLVVRRLSDGAEHEVSMPEPVYSAWVGENLEFDVDTLRFDYTSLVEPLTAYDEHLERADRTLVKRAPVLGGFDSGEYTSTRIWAIASDGVRIPISVVHRRDVALDGSAPALLHGYGSYEISSDPAFSFARLTLLDRGFVYAIAHVRGGGEMGRDWYENGRLTRKRNTFTDFIACAEHLVVSGYTSADRLGARGGSAGGLLVGAVVNLRPDLFRAVVAQVPFVDCLTTMLDPSLPLTVTEWEEWGNPRGDADVYAYMKAYSPYDNVAECDYPAILVTAGLNDPRVSFWEPAKWVAKLRATKTDDRPLILKTEMGAGHGGPSGRYDAWRDEALVLAFLIDQLTGGTP